MDLGSNQTVSLQFPDRLRQMVPDPTTALLSQNNAISSTIASSAFQTVNVLSFAGSASYATTNPPRGSSHPASPHPFYNPQMSVPDSHRETTNYDYYHLFPQGNTYYHTKSGNDGYLLIED
jgi:hypothetical protein